MRTYAREKADYLAKLALADFQSRMERLYSLIFEIREDRDGEYYHLVTLWRATKQEQRLYEKNIQE